MEIENNLFQSKIDQLLIKEKTARQNNDAAESSKILCEIVQICFDVKEFPKLFEYLVFLSKKRGQAKKALIDMVKLGMTFIEKMPDLDTKLALIQTLKEVCDKKIYLEVEYARCCLMLVKLKEDENNVNEAAKILQEVQVETYGSMDRREKLEFILYQMRIMIKKQDYVRLYIISKKINKKNIEDAGLEDLKILFYGYLVIYFNHENKFLEAAECYKHIFDTYEKNPNLINTHPKKIEFDFNVEYQNVLEHAILFLVISQHSKDQVGHLNNFNLNYTSVIEKFPHLNELLKQILSTELISTNPADYGLANLEIFSQNYENHLVHQQNFRKQLIQHNIRVIAKYYERVQLARAAQLMAVDVETTESEICEMINNKLIVAKINRIEGIISFKPKKNENEVLNEWVFDLGKVLDLVDKTCHLINRENDVYS